MKWVRFLVVAIAAICLCGVAQGTWCGYPTVYFNHNSTPDITGYETLDIYPSGNPEVDETVTITSASGMVLIDKYISPVGEPGITTLEPGTRRYRTYSYVSTASGITKIWFSPGVRFLNGTEIITPYYVVGTDDINDLTVGEYLTSAVVSSTYNFAAGDRIFIAVYANTTHPIPVTVHWVYQGVTHYSHVDAGEYRCAASTLPVGVYGGYISANPTPLPPAAPIAAIIVAAIAAVAIRRKE